jgi:hypothetical protein
VFVIVMVIRPAEFRVVRTTTISSRPQAIFEQVNDSHNWLAWSQWEKLDPELK